MTAPAPRPSSTVVLVRDGATKPEMLMVARHAATAFGAINAFPGGVLDPCDDTVSAQCNGLSAATANRNLGLDSGGLAFYSAAIRELFEEVGIFLGETPDDRALPALRARLNAGALKWSDAVRDGGLVLHADRLQYFAHWVTPEGEPKRFSTRFFVAALPENQVATADDGELTGCTWVSADEAIAANRDGGFPLIFPTQRTVQELRAFSTAAEIVGWARDRAVAGVDVRTPLMVTVDGEVRFVLPGEAIGTEDSGP